MSTRQTVAAALILGLVAAAVVWWLERFNRDLLLAQFRAELERLPTFEKGEGT